LAFSQFPLRLWTFLRETGPRKTPASSRLPVSHLVPLRCMPKIQMTLGLIFPPDRLDRPVTFRSPQVAKPNQRFPCVGLNGMNQFRVRAGPPPADGLWWDHQLE